MSLPLPSYPYRLLHLTTVWAYAVSQPVFSMLSGNPEFLVVRGSTRAEVVVFAVSLTIGPPLLALFLESLVSLVSRTAGAVLHLVFLALFFAPLGLFLLTLFDPGPVVAVSAAMCVAAVFVTAYVRWRQFRSFLTLSVILPAAGLVLFLTGIPLVVDDVAGAQVRVGSHTPVVVLVLDELPTSSLMTPAGDIDAVRYPNFARLARDSTWYRRATTVHEHTTGAVPAIVSGRLPLGPELPILADHPQSLFTLLGERYRMRVQETATYMCPTRYCPRDREPLLRRLDGLFADARIAYLHLVLPDSLKGGLPKIGERWSGLNRDRLLVAQEERDVDTALRGRSLDHAGQLADFTAGISASSDRTLYFSHLVLPHTPWRFLPSGHQYGGEYSIEGRDDAGVWTKQAWPVRHAFQRHLLQVEYTDRLLGQLLDRLEATGVYKRSLVVVVSDHGSSFIPGQSARKVTPGNLADVARVPLFVKFPGQEMPNVDLRPVRTIDVLPTIADVLDVKIPWKVDGRSLLTAGWEPTKVMVRRRDGGLITSSNEEVDRVMNQTIRRKTRLFGMGSDSLYEAGSSRELSALAIRDLPVADADGASVRFEDETAFADVDLAAYVPARVFGDITGFEVPPGREVAVAVNGRIAAAGGTYRLGGRQRFSALVPPTAFRNGVNRVELFLVESTRPTPKLIRLGVAGERRR